MSVFQNSDEIKATDAQNVKDVFFVTLFIYLQIKINHRNHHAATLDFTNLFVKICGIFAYGKYKKQHDTFMFLISDSNLLVVHRPNNDYELLNWRRKTCKRHLKLS